MQIDGGKVETVTDFIFLGSKITVDGDCSHKITRHLILGAFPGGSDGKASAYNAGDLGSTPGLGRSPGEGSGKPTPVSLPGKSHGRRSLLGYSPWGRKVRHDWATSLHFDPWKESYNKPKQHIKKKRHYFATKGPYSQINDFSSGHIWMWE